MKKETIAIQRPQGADLQPLIFRIPEVVLELFRCYLQAACRVGVWGGERSGWGWSKPPLRAIWPKTNEGGSD